MFTVEMSESTKLHFATEAISTANEFSLSDFVIDFVQRMTWHVDDNEKCIQIYFLLFKNSFQ